MKRNHAEKNEGNEMMKSKSNERFYTAVKTLKRTKTVLTILVCVALVMGSTLGAFADPGTDIIGSITSLTDIIFAIIRAVGLILTGLGIFNIGSSLTSHDASQRSQGFMLVGGGLIIFFVKEILSAIGVSI